MFPGLLLAFSPLKPLSHDISFYVGTYTSEQGSKGIYAVRMDSETGRMREPELVATTSNPSYLAMDARRHTLYAVDESNVGFVSAFAMGADSKLTFLNKQPSQGAAPCHVSIGDKSRRVFVANYSDGVLASMPIQADGSLGSPDWKFANTGTGPDKDRQEGPHAHSIYTDPKNRFLFSCDLGADELLVFPPSPNQQPRSRVKLPPGSGPRHAAMNRSGKVLYVCNELGNTVSTVNVEPTGPKEVIQTVSTLPDGTPVQGSNTAEIVVHPKGPWLYVSNRGHDSIAVFAILPNGQLERVEIKPLSVRIPRGFDIDPTGKWLVVAGQNSNDLESFAVDAKTGKLKSTSSKISLPSPVCILFAKS